MRFGRGRSRADGGCGGAPPGATEDVSHAALLAALSDARRTAALVAMTAAMARSGGGVHREDAEDAFQDAVVTYLEVQARYPPDVSRFALLVGIFRCKVLAFAAASRRRRRALERLARGLSRARDRRVPGRDAAGAADGRMMREETAAAIRTSIASLPDGIRSVLLCLAEGRRRRLELVRELGINRNTFDSRLHVARRILRRTAVAAGAM
jgi:DNA-directed RNA polymerase specialized sigma24 family protein